MEKLSTGNVDNFISSRKAYRRAALYERMQIMSSIRNTYDEFASQYAQLMSAQERAGVEPGSNIAQFLQVVGEVSGLTVLDAGCGEGYHFPFFMILSFVKGEIA